jgi:hypothetical protein
MRAGRLPEERMRKTALAPGAVCLLALACQSAPPDAPTPTAEASAPAASHLFEPARGVRCNRHTHVCEHRGGPSVGLTRLFFGDAAASAIDAAMREKAYPHDRIFQPSRTVSCDTLVTTCYDQNGVSRDLTSRYFGSNAAKLLDARRRSVEQRGAHVTCDRGSGVCYDPLGAGYGATRMYIGEPEADLLVRRLRPF